jgi:hypothetical protein
MNPFTVLLPHIAGLGALALVAVLMTLWTIPACMAAMMLFDGLPPGRRSRPPTVAGLRRDQWERVLYWPSVLLILGGSVAVFLRLSTFWLLAAPTSGWQQQTATSDTVIVFGFGLEFDPQHRVTPGAANRVLADWVLDRRHGGTMIVQEGVLAAATEAPRASRVAGWEIRRMHRDDRAVYVNTLEAAYCALEQMERLGRKRALVVAHELQLARAAADLRRVASSNPRWRDYEFVVPDVGSTPFPEGSAQWHTRDLYRYTAVEMFLSRPRDVFSPVPRSCDAPAADVTSRR